jgi:hypothetical protein
MMPTKVDFDVDVFWRQLSILAYFVETNGCVLL